MMVKGSLKKLLAVFLVMTCMMTGSAMAVINIFYSMRCPSRQSRACSAETLTSRKEMPALAARAAAVPAACPSAKHVGATRTEANAS